MPAFSMIGYKDQEAMHLSTRIVHSMKCCDMAGFGGYRAVRLISSPLARTGNMNRRRSNFRLRTWQLYRYAGLWRFGCQG